MRMASLTCALGLGMSGPLANAQTNITVRSEIILLLRSRHSLPDYSSRTSIFGADGAALYPERVKKTRSLYLRFPDPLMGWTQTDAGSQGAIYILDRGLRQKRP